MTASEPGGLHARILESATRLFVARGYHGISMREIAEAVGVSKAGLYYHFADKQELFLAILDAYLVELEQQIDRAIGATCDVRGRIRAVLEAIFALGDERRGLIQLANQEMVHLDQAARARFSERYHRGFLGRIEALLAEGISGGALRRFDPHLGTWILLGMAYPFLTHNRAGQPADSTITLIETIFFDGTHA